VARVTKTLHLKAYELSIVKDFFLLCLANLQSTLQIEQDINCNIWNTIVKHFFKQTLYIACNEIAHNMKIIKLLNGILYKIKYKCSTGRIQDKHKIKKGYYFLIFKTNENNNESKVMQSSDHAMHGGQPRCDDISEILFRSLCIVHVQRKDKVNWNLITLKVLC
jgi:Zn/Cd-binding protein ZinT